MKMTDRKGDRGKTDIKDIVVSKDSKVIEAIGSLDELTAVLGVVFSKTKQKVIENIIEDLCLMMGQLSGFGVKKINWNERVVKMDKDIKTRQAKFGKVNTFLKINSDLDVWLNWARTVCRRSERVLVKYSKSYRGFDLNILKYINRLSGYLFTLSRKK